MWRTDCGGRGDKETSVEATALAPVGDDGGWNQGSGPETKNGGFLENWDPNSPLPLPPPPPLWLS